MNELIDWQEVYNALDLMRTKYQTVPTEWRVSESQLRNALRNTLSCVREVEDLYNGLPTTITGATIVLQDYTSASKGRWELIGVDKDGKQVMLTGTY